MIRCPQCEFENPDDHKFCQRCGTSLAEVIRRSDDQDMGLTTRSASRSEREQGELEFPPLTGLPISESETNLMPEASPGKSTLESHPPQYQPSIWTAVVTWSEPSVSSATPSESSDPSETQTPTASSSSSSEALRKWAIALQERKTLDAQGRYQVLLPLPPLEEGVTELEFKVLDRDPSKPSNLAPLFSQSPLQELNLASDVGSDDLVDDPNADDEDVTVNLTPIPDSSVTMNLASSALDPNPLDEDAALDESFADENPFSADSLEQSFENQPFTPQSSPSDSSNQQTHSRDSLDSTASEAPHSSEDHSVIPAIATAYLNVQNQLYPSLPQIHDAWVQEGYAIVLLDDRDALPSLEESLRQPGVIALQVLHWLHEMAEIWAVLEPERCRQSLLKQSNLCVDEDQILCLKRLYREADANSAETTFGAEPTLNDLGRVWHQLLDGVSLRESHEFKKIYDGLESGSIETLDDLRSCLEEIADRLHDREPPLPTSQSTAGEPIQIAGDQSVTFDLSGTGFSEPTLIGGEHSPKLWNIQDTAEVSFGLYPEGDETPTVVLPMRLFNLSDAGLTDIGRQRDHNEDYFSINSKIDKKDSPAGRVLSAKGLYILCDGMGGHAAGEVASALAVSSLQNYFEEHWHDQLPTQEHIRAAIAEANKSIYDLNQQNANHGSGRMGTTLVMMLVHDTKVAIAHVGDSRLYRFGRRTGLEQLTVDHEVGQREIQRGIEPSIAYARPDAYQLTQALGPRDERFINPDIQFLEINEDALFILCSDGLTDNDLLEQNCASYIEPMLSSQANLEQELYRLIDFANQENGHDNITAVVVRMKVRPKLQSS